MRINALQAEENIVSKYSRKCKVFLWRKNKSCNVDENRRILVSQVRNMIWVSYGNGKVYQLTFAALFYNRHIFFRLSFKIICIC